MISREYDLIRRNKKVGFSPRNACGSWVSPDSNCAAPRLAPAKAGNHIAEDLYPLHHRGGESETRVRPCVEHYGQGLCEHR